MIIIDEQAIKDTLDEYDIRFIKNDLKEYIELNDVEALRSSIESYKIFTLPTGKEEHATNIIGLLYSVGIDMLADTKEIPISFFSKNNWLHEIEIPTNIEKISTYSFRSNAHLNKIVLPASIREINNFAFFTCPNLETIIYKGTRKQFESIKKERNCLSSIGNLTQCKLILKDDQILL